MASKDFSIHTMITVNMPKCPYCNAALNLRNMLYAPKSKDDKPDPIQTVLLDNSKAHLWACPACDKILAITEIPR